MSPSFLRKSRPRKKEVSFNIIFKSYKRDRTLINTVIFEAHILNGIITHFTAEGEATARTGTDIASFKTSWST